MLLKNKKKNTKDGILNLYEGGFNGKDYIASSYINTLNPKYIEIDNTYYTGIMIVNYYREYTDIILKNLIDTNVNMKISMFYEKQDSYKVIRDLTYHIGTVAVDLKESNQNRQDIDIVTFTHNDAKYIRKEIQVNNDEMYYLYIYLQLYDKSLKELEYNVNKIEGLCKSNGLITRKANFRQEQAFIACLPFMKNDEILKVATKRNILTSGLIATYPFISSSLFDEGGIYIGTNIYNNSLVFIDRYDKQKYKNANMCIFGTSGARKVLLYKITNIKI